MSLSRVTMICSLGVVSLLWSLLFCSATLEQLTLVRENSLSDANRDPNIPQTELNALHALYNATDGENWSWPPDRNRTGLLPWQRGGPWMFTADANPCADNWYGIKCTDSVPNHVEFIILPAQNLTGTIPDAIGYLPFLQKLEFRHNPNLTGTIPDIFGNLTLLQGLDMSHNNLNGTLPPSLLATADTLESLVVYRNLLTGTFPTFLCELSQLLELNLANNSLHGKLPDCIGQLARIHGLTVSVNQFTGTLPQTLGNMTNIKEISFDDNAFTGPIPESLGDLKYLKYFGVFITTMSGQVPDSICKMQSMEGMFLYNSLFSGTIPYCLSNMSALTTYDANGNYFTGTIPADLLAKEGLQDLAIRDSAVEGTLPSVLASTLQTLELGGNKLHGTLPSAAFALRQLQVLEVYDNKMTGPLPKSMKGAESITTLHMGQNYFTGPIPSDIGNCSALAFVLLNNNLMTGPLPHSLANLPLLAELAVDSNFFSGSIAGNIDSTVHTTLATVLLSDNRFTGQIPDDLFRLRALTVFAAVSNCFDTQLTDAMCKSDSLQTLALDGLRSGKSCRTNLLHGLTSAYAVEHALTQRIPDCLFQMRTLTTLHLSGNGLTGQLPGNITISRALLALSLSHNELRGVIPHNFQMKPWAKLDLSYNRLTGTLSDAFAQENGKLSNQASTYVDLSLENNRISGRVPHKLLDFMTISILGSNIFDCNTQKTDLPQQDEGLENYHCASKSFDVPYYLWLGLLVLCAVVAALLTFGNTRFGEQLTGMRLRVANALASIHDATFGRQIRAVSIAVTLYNQVCVLAAVCVGYMLVVLVPFYLAAAKLYGTFYHQYAWQVSAALLSGRTAAAVLMVLLLSLLCLFIGPSRALARWFTPTELKNENRSGRPNSTASVRINPAVILSWCERYCVFALFMTISVSVVVGVNVAYVVVVLNQESNVVVVVQIFLAFFKLFWNNFCSKNLMRWTGRQISKSVDATESVHGAEFHFVQLFVSLFNNIAIPCIVVAVISPNCLYNVFVPAPVVDSSYVYQSCVLHGLVDGKCLNYDPEIGSTSYDPPFVYSYQCSSSIVTYYAPAFVFLCITATFLTPCSQFVAMRLARDERLPSWARTALQYYVPKILMPPVPPEQTETSTSDEPTKQSPYFDANRVIILLFSYFGMLMTFGAVFPPLAVALAVTICSTTFFIKLKIGSFLLSAMDLKAMKLVDTLNAECKQLAQMSVLEPSVWLIVTFSCWFYTLFLFDTLGDAVGFHKAYWVLIVMPLMPVCLYILYYIFVRYLRRNDGKLEMSSISETTVSPLGRQVSSTEQVELSDIYSRPSESV